MVPARRRGRLPPTIPGVERRAMAPAEGVLAAAGLQKSRYRSALARG
jgi:hypothetical protein